MANCFKHRKRFRVLVGFIAHQVYDGFEIGIQRYPDQFKLENLTYEQIMKMHQTDHSGIWLSELNTKIEHTDPRNVTITDEGVNYSNNYIDLCVPFDRNGTEISVGDYLYAAVRNEVRKVKVTKIAKKPFHATGAMVRKLTVVDEEQQTLTINYPYSTVKC